MQRRIIVRNPLDVSASRTVETVIDKSGVSDRSMLEQLGYDYKQFKEKNPNKWARLPQSIKVMAREVLEGGATYSDIAKVTGLTQQAVLNWVPKKKNMKASNLINEPIYRSESVIKDNKEYKQLKKDWVLIRIEGREVEVLKEDFWGLLLRSAQT